LKPAKLTKYVFSWYFQTQWNLKKTRTRWNSNSMKLELDETRTWWCSNLMMLKLNDAQTRWISDLIELKLDETRTWWYLNPIKCLLSQRELVTLIFQTFRLAGLASNTFCVKGTECNETDGNDPAKIREGRFETFPQCRILKIFLSLVFYVKSIL